jgi:flagellar biogenesis protein FliO
MSIFGTYFPVTARRSCALVVGLALVAAGTVVGAEPTNAVGLAPLTAPATPSLIGPLLRLLGALALVLALLFGAQWWLRQSRRAGWGKIPGCGLKVLEVKSLGHRQALYVVGYERQRLLIATSPTGVNLLATLPEATGTDPLSESPTPAGSFAEALLQVVGRH